MNLAVTVWRLADRVGRPACCELSQRDGGWQLLVHRGAELFMAERCASDDAAFVRANEIWSVLREQGWTEPVH